MAYEVNRRTVLKSLGSVAAGMALSRTGFAALSASLETKPFRGLFPIGQTPFTQDDKLDFDCLAAEVKFCNRASVPGFIWPQIASGWSTMSASERFAGAEAILAAGKGGKTALIIGVQTQNNDLPGAIAFAQHAAKNGADAICSLPPKGDDAAMLSYYKAIGNATDLPLFVQTIGDMSVDLIVEMFRSIPTMRVVKDEAGDPLARVTEIRQRTGDKIGVFAGKGVRLMIEEMQLGFAGYCPVVALADVYQQAFELYEAGKPREAFDMFGRILAFDSISHADQYLMVARGIFKENTKSRPMPGMGDPANKPAPPTESDKKAVLKALDTYLKPYLRG
ncbi:MAG: dihydrodipicolinate synthase family protein [Terracidiphilus sp.]|jgi:4-hydroxy-tetrahydrodipicolinate synthase